jgi:hypothetical protein
MACITGQNRLYFERGYRQCRCDKEKISVVVAVMLFQEPQLSDFEKVVHHHAQDIVRKWADFFLFGKKINCTQIKRRIK